MRDYRSPLQKIRRLLKLLECLQSGHGYHARQLAELCGVSRRQIFRDLRALQDSGITVLYDSQRQNYSVAQSTFLPATELTLEEALSLLVLAVHLGAPQQGLPLFEPARDAALKLSSALPLHLRQYVGEMIPLVEVRAPSPAQLSHCRDVLAALHLALQTRHRVRLRYHSFSERKEIETLLCPYRVFYRRHSWYVVGRSSRDRAVRMFHLGRILQLTPTDDPYDIPKRFSLERYFGNAWQFIREHGPDHTVRIRFQKLVAGNVAEVLWHKTQQLEWNDDGTLDYIATVSGLNEISWWVLGYGDQAEALEPPELRELIAARVQNLSRTYKRKPPRRKSRQR